MIAAEQNTRRPPIEDQIEQLGSLSRTELVELWIKQYKCQPPKGVKRGLLERAAGYQLQSKRSRKLNSATMRALIANASGQERLADAIPKRPR